MGWLDGDSKRENEILSKARTPSDLAYMKFLRVIFRIMSAWPGKELGEKCLFFEGKTYVIYNSTLSLVYLALGLWYLKDNIEYLNFLELGHMYLVLLLNMLSSSRCLTLVWSKKYPIVAFDFVKKNHLIYFRHKSEFSMKIFKQVHRLSHLFTVYMVAVSALTLFLFNMTPVYNNYINGKYASTKNLVNTTYEHAIYFKFPFNAYTNFNGYIVASVINWYGSFLCASSITMFDLMLALMVFNLWGHFKLLLNHLETFPRPAAEYSKPSVNSIKGSEQYSATELVVVAEKLKEGVIYHRMIADFANKMSDAFGLALFIYFLFHQISGCIMLLEVSQLSPQALARYLPLTILMFQQLIQVSVIFEIIGSMSAKVKDAVYEIPWECMDTKNRKTVLIFLVNTQEPISVKAGGLVPIGVTTMASIMKTSFSYFAFLRTVGE